MVLAERSTEQQQGQIAPRSDGPAPEPGVLAPQAQPGVGAASAYSREAIQQVLTSASQAYSPSADDPSDYFPVLSSWLYPPHRAPNAEAVKRRDQTTGARAARAIYQHVGSYSSPERTLRNDGTQPPLKPWKDDVVRALTEPGLPPGTLLHFFDADHIPGSLRDDVALAVYERLKPRLADMHWTDLWILAKELNNGYLSETEDAAVTEIYTHLTPKQVAEGERRLADEGYRERLRDAVIAPADAPLDQVVAVDGPKLWRLAPKTKAVWRQWPLGKVYKFLSNWSDGDSDEAVKQAIEAGPPPNAPMSKLTVTRASSIGGVLHGRSWLMVPANMLKPDGKLIISHPYHDDSPQSQLRPLTHFPEAEPAVDLSEWGAVGKPLEWLLNLFRDSGTPLPEHLLGRIFAVGLPTYRFDSIPAASDMLLEEFESIRKHGKQYGIELPRAGNAAGEHVDIYTHSQAAVETLTLAREDVRGWAIQASIRALSPPLGGSRLADESPLGMVLRFLALVLGGSEAAEAIPHLAPHRVRIPEHIILECRIKAAFPTTGEVMTWKMLPVKLAGGGDDGLLRVRDGQHPCDPDRTRPIPWDHLLSAKHWLSIWYAAALDYLTGESPANKSPFAEIGNGVGPWLSRHGYPPDKDSVDEDLLPGQLQRENALSMRGH
jgi:hypothetical protein